ncbi:MAG TPA: porin family protein [Draconibacterium sp.]|nr:porin family protein [Draconibacterium sp.]
MKQKLSLLGRSLLMILLTGVTTLGSTFVSKAQMSYGIKAGVGVACQSDLLRIADNCDALFSPSFGLVGKYQFSDSFALKSGLEYQYKGRSFTEENSDISDKLQYLTLPVKAEFSAGEKAGFNKGQRVYFAIGPYLSYLLDAEKKLDNQTSDLSDDTKNFDTGLSYELGIEFPVFNQKTLQVGLNYDMGFVELYKSEPDLHNKMASISLGLLF